ncbi:MAG: NAD-dependent epimerase/dehydratase family protein, partial [Alcanivoracaceae bacterium]
YDLGSDALPVSLSGVDCVVHCAARVHQMNDQASDPLASFRRHNRDATLVLARAAADAGVRRFVFISSIKVNGEQTRPGQPFRADDRPAPEDPYGQSKAEAEEGLRAVAAETGMEVVIIRPPLVYGPGVRANFAALMGLVARGLPLPFGRVDNRRSLVFLDNLVDLVLTCCDHPAAAGQVFLVSDDDDLSLARLVRELAAAMGRPARLLPVPVSVMSLVARLLGRADLVKRLFGSLQVEVGPTRERLGWTPPVTVSDAFRRTVRAGSSK